MRKGKIVRVSQSKNIEQAIMDAILIEIDEKIKQRKKQNKGGSIRCCTYGVTSEIINRHRRANPWLNRDVLNNYKWLLTRKKKVIHVDFDTNRTSISSLTESTDATKVVQDSMDDEPTPITEAPAAEMPAAEAPVEVNNLPIVEAPAATDTVNRGGRPKGTTNDQIRQSKKSKKLAMNFAASQAALMKESSKANGYDRI
jgi:hypothetical protein